MSDERQTWDRIEDEPGNWYARFLLFRNMAATQRGFYQAYVEEARISQKKHAKHIPGSWSDAADKWQWRKRADAYDAHLLGEQEAKEARLRQLEEEEEARLLSTGYARSARRVEQLSTLYDEMKASYHVKDEAGDDKIVYHWLTPEKVREMRGCLDDIAKEVGERVKKAELTGKDGAPLEFICEWGSGATETDDQDEG
jgi:hypothetical protein